MKLTIKLITFFLLLLSSFSPLEFTIHTISAKNNNQNSWQTKFKKILPLFGHRNFIVIADSAYPLQSHQGITTLYTGDKQLVVLKEVLASIEESNHVNGIIYVDKELEYVSEKYAEGINDYRKSLNTLLKDKSLNRIPHMEIITKLDKSAELFNVLILKTDLTLPYTSVFIELDAGYWNAEKEQELRKAIKNK